jgi:hypothetical protein
MKRCLLLVAIAGCGNDLPSSGACAIPSASGEPTVVQVPLVGRPAGFDDLRYAPALGKVVAAPEGAGRIYLVDPDTLEVTQIGATGGTASADADATTVYAIDRANDRVVAFDIATGSPISSANLDGNPDYMRLAPDGKEIWITVPGLDRIDIVSITGTPPTLARSGTIRTPGAPEGLTFSNGRAYTQSGGRAIAIDFASKTVVGDWDTGCGSSHGFPQVDDGYGLVVGGCDSSGGAAVLSREGDLRTGIEVGGDATVLAYDHARHHLYLRGDPGGNLKMIGVCRDGGMTVMAEVAISSSGHASTSDERGNVWVGDATTGGLQKINDPFASTE